MKQANYMFCALDEAKKALYSDDVPVGAVIVCNGEIVASSHNTKEIDNCAVSHAEINAIKKATSKLERWRLSDCELYVTLEPCPMCMGAILNSRINKLHIALKDPKAGSCGSIINLNDYPFNHKTEIVYGECEKDSKELLSHFFKEKRLNNKEEL